MAQKIKTIPSRLELSDEVFEDFKTRINDTIHELVFAVQHMDQGDVEEAQNCLFTAGLSLEAVSNEYDQKRAEDAAA